MMRYYSQVVMKMGKGGTPVPLERPVPAEG
jgi:hypothetical protein